MKAMIGLNQNRYVDLKEVAKLVSTQEDMAFAQHVADEAITLVRNNEVMLPIRPYKSRNSLTNEVDHAPESKPRFVTLILAESLDSTNGKEFERELRIRRPNAKVYYVDNRTVYALGRQVLEDIKDADDVIVAAYIVNAAARQAIHDGKTITLFGLKGASGVLLQEILKASPQKIVVVAFGSPYVISNFRLIQNYMCTYAMASTSEISAVKALFGEIQNHARLPISLPGVAPLGFSLPWPTRRREQPSLAVHP